MTKDYGRHIGAYEPQHATCDEARAYSHGYGHGFDAGTSLPEDHPLLETYRQETARADAAEAKLREILEVLDISPTQLVRNWENYTELYEWADHERCDRIRSIVKREGTTHQLAGRISAIVESEGGAK